MAEKIAHKLLTSIRPLHIQSRLFGLTTISQKTLKSCRFQFLFNTLLVSTYLPTISYCVYITATKDNPIIYRATNIIILVVNAAYLTTTWTCAITNRGHFADLLVRLIDFDAKIHTLGVRLNYRRCQRKILAQGLVRYVCVVANVAALAYLALVDAGADMVVEGMAYFLIVVNSAVCHQTAELVLMLRVRFVILNRQIGNLIEAFLKKGLKVEARESLLVLNRICALHHHLSKLVRLFNETFGLVLLLMFGVSFVIIVISIFYLTSTLQSDVVLVSEVLESLLSNVSFIGNVLYVCDVCYTTIEEVNKSGELIHKIDTEDHDVRDEIEMFSLQIANEQVEFNAAGFFPINYTLVFSILGGVTTYIIILMQLSGSSDTFGAKR